MIARGGLKDKQDYGVDEWIREPIRKTFSEVDEEVNEIMEENISEAPDSRLVGQSIMPGIKGLDLLKEGTYSVDLEKTIADMFGTIKNMEAQLERVLTINTHLEKDLKASRDMISVLKGEKAHLTKTIVRLEEEIPSKREIQIEIDQLIEERNAVQNDIREMKLKLSNAQKAIAQLQQRVAALAEEKRDAVTEINFVESRLNAANEKLRKYESQVNILKGEKLAQMEKIRCLEEELNEVLEEKYRLLRELTESKDALDEVRSTLVESKLQAKKSFYRAGEQ